VSGEQREVLGARGVAVVAADVGGAEVEVAQLQEPREALDGGGRPRGCGVRPGGRGFGGVRRVPAVRGAGEGEGEVGRGEEGEEDASEAEEDGGRGETRTSFAAHDGFAARWGRQSGRHRDHESRRPIIILGAT